MFKKMHPRLDEGVSAAFGRFATDTCLLTIGFALWLCIHPYLGIWHDARVYSLMAMRHLLPDAYANDPWFMFGSQDSYSAFAPLFAAAISTVGLGEGARLIAFLGGLLFALGAYVLSRAALPRAGPLSFFLLLTIPLSYCPNHWGLIQVSESFATARPWSIAASLIGLALHLRGQKIAALVPYALGLALHPLMTIGACAVSLAVELRAKALGIATLVLVITALAGILTGVPSLQALTEPWRTLVVETAGIVFIPGPHHDPAFVAACAAVILLASAYGTQPLRKFYLSCLFVGCLGYLTTILASTYYPSALIMQSQPWRALWLVTVFAVVALADLASQFFHGARTSRPVLLIAATLLLLFDHGGSYVLLAITLTFTIAPRMQRAFESVVQRHRLSGALWLLTISTALTEALILTVHFEILGAQNNVVFPQISDFLRGILDVGGFGIVGLLAWWLTRRLDSRALLMVAPAFLWLSVQIWDQRTDAVQIQETQYRASSRPTFFTQHLHQGETVYWPQNPERVWFDLHTASYASGTQTTGIVFSEAFALEMERRMERVIQFGLPDSLFGSQGVTEQERFARAQAQLNRTDRQNIRAWERSASAPNAGLTLGSLKYLCADPALHWVIDTQLYDEALTAQEEIPVPNRGLVKHGLYDCRKLRET